MNAYNIYGSYGEQHISTNHNLFYAPAVGVTNNALQPIRLIYNMLQICWFAILCNTESFHSHFINVHSKKMYIYRADDLKIDWLI